MKKLVHNLLGWNSSIGYGNIIDQQQYVKTTNPKTQMTQEEWMEHLGVSKQFTFMEKNHYTEAVVNISL